MKKLDPRDLCDTKCIGNRLGDYFTLNDSCYILYNILDINRCNKVWVL